MLPKEWKFSKIIILGSLSHYVGKYTSENLGMFHVVDQNNIEIAYDNGEILVETEPISYELKNIRYVTKIIDMTL